MRSKLSNILIAGLLGLVSLASAPAFADYRGGPYGHGYERGYEREREHRHGNGWAWGIGGLVAGALIADSFSHRAVVTTYQPAPVYVAPQPVYYEQPAAVYAPPPVQVVSVQPQPGNSWYYCQRPQGYYPYVQQCYSGWMAVPAGR